MTLPEGGLDNPILTTAGLLFESTAGLARRLEGQLACSGLSPQWFEVLVRLARTPGQRLRMTDLAAQTTLTLSGLSRAVDRLEAAGLVARETCPSDRRGAFAALTPDGRARIEAALPGHVSLLEELLGAALSPAEIDALTALARKVRDTVSPAAARASTCP